MSRESLLDAVSSSFEAIFQQHLSAARKKKSISTIKTTQGKHNKQRLEKQDDLSSLPATTQKIEAEGFKEDKNKEASSYSNSDTNTATIRGLGESISEEVIQHEKDAVSDDDPLKNALGEKSQHNQKEDPSYFVSDSYVPITWILVSKRPQNDQRIKKRACNDHKTSKSGIMQSTINLGELWHRCAKSNFMQESATHNGSKKLKGCKKKSTKVQQEEYQSTLFLVRNLRRSEEFLNGEPGIAERNFGIPIFPHDPDEHKLHPSLKKLLEENNLLHTRWERRFDKMRKNDYGLVQQLPRNHDAPTLSLKRKKKKVSKTSKGDSGNSGKRTPMTYDNGTSFKKHKPQVHTHHVAEHRAECEDDLLAMDDEKSSSWKRKVKRADASVSRKDPRLRKLKAKQQQTTAKEVLISEFDQMLEEDDDDLYTYYRPKKRK
eukprot:m.13656 g.13656  ORF g.13656 m.13656 type:complete len:432 (-) comp4182_c0_seq1:2267-3562(-)